jgi:hypothetical protein
MSNKFYSPHPEDDELLSYSDNELEGSSVGRVRKHLKECWRCRTQIEDLQATVTGFMRYRDHTLVPNLPAPPHSWKNLKSDFDRIDRENANLAARSPMFARFGPIPAMRISRIAVGVAALAVIGFGFGYVYVMRTELPVSLPPKASVGTLGTPAAAPPVIVQREAVPQPKTPPGSVPATEPPARLMNAEVEVAVVLHRASADLGEPVEVLRGPNGIIVTGTALSANRRQELTTALSPIPGVSIRWEDTRISHNPSRPNASFDAGRLPWQAELEASLGGKAALELTSNDLLDLSDAVTARAVALNKLNTQFAGASLKADDQSKIDAIKADHQRELRNAVNALNRHATPVFEKLGISAEAGSVAAGQGSILQAAQKTDQLLNVLFAGAETNRSFSQTVEELRISMARLRAVATAQ